jgi:hypothetical protein
MHVWYDIFFSILLGEAFASPVARLLDYPDSWLRHLLRNLRMLLLDMRSQVDRAIVRYVPPAQVTGLLQAIEQFLCLLYLAFRGHLIGDMPFQFGLEIPDSLRENILAIY